jgi:hypothetical protein
VRPARVLRHPEDVLGAVLIGVFRVGAGLLVGIERGVFLLEGVRDVLQENETEDDVFVLGRVHVVAQLVGCLPELRLEPEHGAGLRGSVATGRALLVG